MIAVVAMIYKDKSYTRNKPYRHHHIIGDIHAETGDMNIRGDQGFIADDGKFLNRADARQYVIECGQLKEEEIVHDRHIFSEDLRSADAEPN